MTPPAGASAPAREGETMRYELRLTEADCSESDSAYGTYRRKRDALSAARRSARSAVLASLGDREVVVIDTRDDRAIARFPITA